MTVIRPAIDAAVRAAVRSSNPFDTNLPKQLTRGLWAAALVLGLGTVAQAQEKPADPQTATASSLEEITVTGSRIKRTNDFNTPTPTTVIDTSAMESQGVVNVGQTLNLTPANASTFTPANSGNSPYFVGAYIPDLRGLNPYFGSRTLTLVDGQRFVQTAQGDQIDLNFIPQILVQRIDVVTGGASAAYGSGAIAGVENIILDRKLEGGKLDGDWSETSKSDAKDHHFGAAYGTNLFDDKVHITIGGELERQDALGCQDVRNWCAQDQGAYQTAATYPAGSLNPLTTPLGFGSGLSQFTSPYGVFVNIPRGVTSTVQGNTTGTGGTPYSVTQPYASAATAFINAMPAGNGGIPLYQYDYLMPQISRGVVMAMLDGKITDDINWKGSGYFGKVDNTKYLQTVGTTYDFLPSDNAYIQGSPTLQNAQQQYALFPAGALYPGSLGYAPINKDWSTQVPEQAEFNTTVKRVTFGLDGKFGQSTWTWDANFEYGYTNRTQIQTNNLHNYAADMALDSVIGPNGQPECRVTADGFAGAVAANPLAAYAGADPRIAQGCVPVNPFGNQPLSAAQQAYMFGNLVEQLGYGQTDANINASGEFFDGIGAGAFTAAVGYEFRREVGNNVDQPGVPEYIGYDYQTQYGQSFGGAVNVNEGYLELNLPLLKDQPFAHLLELDVAGRQSRYENKLDYSGVQSFEQYAGQTFAHNLSTWKASLIWEPIEGYRFRGSQSRDARAANFRELYYGQVISAGGTFGYCDPSGGRNDPCNWNLEGNPNLKPETSDTTTLGIVLTPTWAPGLSFSADWFHIKINDAIEAANPTVLLDGCSAGIASDCNQMTFYNPGPGNTGTYNAATANQSLATTPAEIAAAQQFYQSCFQQGNATCTRNVAAITPQSYNGAFYLVSGVDFSLQDTFDAGPLGNFTTRLLTTWTGQQTFANCTFGAAAGCYSYSILGQTGSGNGFLNDYTPDARWRGSLIITWQKGPLSLTPSMNFVGHGTMDYLGITPAAGALYNEVLTGKMPNGQPISAALANYGYHPMPYNYVPSYFLFNLNATYTFKDGPAQGLQLFTQVNNLFNKQPPFADGGGSFGPTNLNGGTNPIYFDTLGLDWRVGFRYRF